ncbi:M14 family metallopeptidase [Robertkochia sediminum]|uniref:M14 family metallopeptidase n=1 Tax=Robertkochia sediminum TaxID=2785326 RepID=UPI0019317686|nr:M14 family metallopeptidase [Robertkochia sediminum]MBL7471634.1 M14 family metallopeptidase [Robertkochia sediminum]
MLKKIFFLALVLFLTKTRSQNVTNDLQTIFEATDGKETATYNQVVAYYQMLAERFEEIKVTQKGLTDSEEPLMLVTFTPKAVAVNKEQEEKPLTVLINNGIHPGEPDGIDATMMLFRDLATGKLPALQHTVVATIPVYNIGGALNRNSHSRTNQNGPEAYGFRGNARNYDLNRDFIKSDTRNASAFAGIYHELEPDIFIDNHVSNGADYQYTLTHLFTQHNKLGGQAGDFLHKQLRPELENKLLDAQWDITPYVNVFNSVPEKGFSQFFDSPRYSTGYTTLWNTLGMMVETHMLKPYKPRVEGTYQLMVSMLEIAETNYKTIRTVRRERLKELYVATTYPLTWENDTTAQRSLLFKGYEADIIKSEVTGLDRLKYDRSRPFEKEVAYRDQFKPVKAVTIPEAYLIPVGWHQVITLLRENAIEMELIENDTVLEVEAYRIADYKTRSSAYEGHYQHYNTRVETTTPMVTLRAGMYYRVPTRQKGIRYLLETLEPEATDSFFNWNFFDTILQQKEGFSPYVWEDKAKALLESNSELAKAFRLKREQDPEFATNWYAQLDWLHKRSENYEKAHLNYPVYRIMKQRP